MKLNKIYGIILSAVGAVDTYAGFTMLTSKGAKFASNFGVKPSMLAVAILATGIGLLALGLMKLFVEKK
ncbi:MAG: hypothetical protein UHW86_09145 [Spirochaetota bacterium]|jgi:hypothetical protein|nr:hypothetical protein [Spirochaetota bacterium]